MILGFLLDLGNIDIGQEVGNIDKLIEKYKELSAERTAMQLAEQMATDGISKAKARAILTSLGLGEATKQEGFAAIFSNTEKIKNIALTLKQTAAQKALTIALQLGNSILTMGLSIVGSIIATKFIEWIINTTQEQKELNTTMEESISNFEALESEIKSINKELETTSERIKELEGKENLSFTEQEELENLKSQNDELQRELEYKQALKDIEREKLTKDARDYFNPKKEVPDSDEYNYSGDYLEHLNYMAGNTSEDNSSFAGKKNVIDEAKERLISLQELEEKIKETEATIQNLGTKTEKDYKYKSVWNQSRQQLAQAKEDLVKYQNDLKDLNEQALKDRSNIGNYSSYLDPNFDKDVLEQAKTYFEFADDLLGIGKSKEEKFNEIWNSKDFKDSRKELERLSKTGELTEDTFKNILSDSELNIVDNLTKEEKEIIQSYNDILKEVQNKGIDLNKTIYGNIDTNNRQILEWTNSTIEQYREALESWGYNPEDLLGSYSTVMGTSSNYDGIEIAYSPILQTSSGPVLLSANTVDKYIWSLFEKAYSDGNFNSQELLSLDIEGLEIDGQKIKGLLAEVGEVALHVGEAMHYTGELGAVHNSLKEVNDVANKYEATVEGISKVGLMTPEEIKRANSYKNILAAADGNAKSLVDHINSLSEQTFVEKAKADFSDSFKSLPIYELEKYISLVNSGELTVDNIDSFKGLVKLIEESGTTASSALEKIKEYAEGYEFTLDLSNKIKESFDVLADIREEFKETGSIKFDNLDTIAETFPNLQYAVTAYSQKLITATDLMDLLEEEYQKDVDAFRNNMAQKLMTDEEFHNKVYNANIEFFEELSKAYGIDLRNYSTLAKKKAAIDAELIKSLSSAWSQYYQVVFDENGYASLEFGDESTDSIIERDKIVQDMRKSQAKVNRFNNLIKEMDKMAEDAVEVPTGEGIWDDDGDGSGSGSGNGSDSANDYKETFDFFERRVEVLTNAFDGLSASMENVFGADAKNTIIDAQSGILVEEVKNYGDALAMYTEMANRSLEGLDESLADKIKNGAVELTDFTGENGEAVVEAMEAYKGWADKINECSTKLEDLKKELAQLELAKFNNIVDDYTNKFDLYGNSIDLIDKQIGLFEEAGELVGEAFYEGQIGLSNKQLDALYAEKADLANQLAEALASGNVEKGSEEWLEMVKTMSDLDGQILDTKTTIEQLENAILEIDWSTFDRIQTRFGDLNSELENIVDLFSEFNDINVSDGNGTWTDEAIATLGIYAQQYETAKYQVGQYSEKIAQLKEDYADGKYSATEYADKLAELNNGQWESVKSMNAAEDAIMDLNRARVDEEIETINKAIEAYREYTDSQVEALEAARDLHEYEKSITEKTKNIADIEKKLAAMQNDTSAATIAKRKQLEEELSEARKDLEETEYDHSIDTQVDALNKNYENYEKKRNEEIEALEESLKNREAIISQSFETVKQNAELVGQKIAEIAAEHGVKVSTSLIESWQSGENAIASYGETLSAKSSAFIAQLMNVEQKEWDLQTQANSTSESLVNMFSNKAEGLVAEFDMAISSAERMNDAIIAIQNNLIKVLEGGFDISGLVSQLEEIESAANSASKAVSGIGSGTSNTSYKTEWKTAGKEYKPKTYQIVDASTGEVLMYDIATAKQAKEERSKYYGDYDDVTSIQYIDENRKIRLLKFTKGGIVSKDKENVLDAIAKNVGEDKMVAVKEGEGIFTQEQTKALLKLAPVLDNSKLSWLKQPLIPTESIRPQQNISYEYGSLVTVNGNIDDTNMQKMVNIVRKEMQNTFAKIDRDHRYSGY